MDPVSFNHLEKAFAITLATVCVLATIVLVYYIRRRYILHLYMRDITPEMLWLVSYINHKKNLKIQATIANFAIIIILVEIANNIANVYNNLVILIPYNEQLLVLMVYVRSHTQLCHVPLLCMLLKVIWLAYLHAPYKYTIMRWTAYIVLRSCTILLVYERALENGEGSATTLELYSFMLSLYFAIDTVMYFLYSRRLYQHLKSRELEAKLFMDKQQYHSARLLRIHFQVATILVTLAIVSYQLTSLIEILFSTVNYILLEASFEPYKSHWALQNQLSRISIDICQVVYRILFNINYMYLFLAMSYRYCKQKRKLTRVNDRIKPLVKEYHNRIYNRGYTKYY